MNARETTRLQLGHRIASEIHRMMADSNMSIPQLAAAIGESEAYLKRVLTGENGHSRAIRAQLLADISWATQKWMSIAITPISDAEHSATVESGVE